MILLTALETPPSGIDRTAEVGITPIQHQQQCMQRKLRLLHCCQHLFTSQDVCCVHFHDIRTAQNSWRQRQYSTVTCPGCPSAVGKHYLSTSFPSSLKLCLAIWLESWIGIQLLNLSFLRCHQLFAVVKSILCCHGNASYKLKVKK